MIPCEVFPNRAATTEQLLELGTRLQTFFAGVPFAGATFGDREDDAVGDLLGGELPSPVALRSKMVGRLWNEAMVAKKLALSEVRKARTVAFNIEYLNDDGWKRTRERLREVVPKETVTNVLISGQSWDG
jgi:hypothetical protein